MDTAYLVVALLAIAANAFSGIAALAHFRPILPQFGLAVGFLLLAVATLGLGLPSSPGGG